MCILQLTQKKNKSIKTYFYSAEESWDAHTLALATCPCFIWLLNHQHLRMSPQVKVWPESRLAVFEIGWKRPNSVQVSALFTGRQYLMWSCSKSCCNTSAPIPTGMNRCDHSSLRSTLGLLPCVSYMKVNKNSHGHLMVVAEECVASPPRTAQWVSISENTGSGEWSSWHSSSTHILRDKDHSHVTN